jgi:ribonuclease P/MRP protein subunit RPP1
LLTDASTNHRIPQLLPHYDILAARPKDEKTLRLACEILDVDIVSIDLTVRFPTHFKFKMLSTAVSRGVKIEVCYSQGILASDASARRNLINNVVQLVRVTRGRGLLLSSEAKSVLGVRAPSDVINLASVWGLGKERGKDGLTKEGRSVVEFAKLKRTSYRGAVNIIHGGEKPAPEVEGMDKTQRAKAEAQKKRKVDGMEGTRDVQTGGDKPLSNREKKRREKRTKIEIPQRPDNIEGSGGPTLIS